MGVTPIETYTMVPKSYEASVMKHNEQTQNHAAQSNIVSHIDSKTLHDSRMTVKSQETVKEEYRYDAKDGGNGSYSPNGQRRKKGEKNSESDFSDASKFKRPGSFDVRI